MRRTVLSFTLATLSLLLSYAITAGWPDRGPAAGIAAVAPAPASTVVGLAH